MQARLAGDHAPPCVRVRVRIRVSVRISSRVRVRVRVRGRVRVRATFRVGVRVHLVAWLGRGRQAEKMRGRRPHLQDRPTGAQLLVSATLAGVRRHVQPPDRHLVRVRISHRVRARAIGSTQP